MLVICDDDADHHHHPSFFFIICSQTSSGEKERRLSWRSWSWSGVPSCWNVCIPFHYSILFHISHQIGSYPIISYPISYHIIPFHRIYSHTLTHSYHRTQTQFTSFSGAALAYHSYFPVPSLSGLMMMVVL